MHISRSSHHGCSTETLQTFSGISSSNRAILIDFEYARINEADGVIESAIAEQGESKKDNQAFGSDQGEFSELDQ